MDDDADHDGPTRGRVADFSRKARARMCDGFRSLDYSPLFDEGDFPALVTFTAPGDWESVFPTPRSFKNKVKLLKKEFLRAWGRNMVGVWKMEFQERGAPHLHVLMTPPRGRARASGESFTQWASKTWARIVNVQGKQAYLHHERLGVDVSWKEGARYSDPRRIAVYFDKHAGYHEKDYQNVMPQLWLSAIADGEPGATYWGYWGLAKMQETHELNRFMGARARGRQRQIDYQLEVMAGGSGLSHNQIPSAALLAGLQDNPHYVKSDDTDERARSSALPVRKYEQSETAVVVMRHLRRLARSKSYVRKTEVWRTEWKNHEVDYVDPLTGEVTTGWRKATRKRKVNRRFSYLKNQTHGFLAVNDGEQAARDIARLLGGSPPLRQRDVLLVA